MPVRDAAPGDSGENLEQREFQIELKRAQEQARRAAWSRYGYERRCPMNVPISLPLDELPRGMRTSGLAMALALLARLDPGVRLRMS